MDDTAPKPPVKPAKAARRPVRDAAAAPAGKPPRAKPKVDGTIAPAAPVATASIAAVTVPPVTTTPVSTAPVSLSGGPAVDTMPTPAAPAPAPVMPVATIAAEPTTTDPIAAATTAPIASLAAKEVIMETIETVTAKTQTAFADATERAKGAVEKSQKMFEDANEFGKGNIEAMVESSKIAVRGLEAMGQDAAAFAKKSFEEATAAAKTMTSVKSPTDFFKLQSDYARSAFDAMVQQTSRNTEAMLKLAGEVAQPLSNRVALAAEKMKVVA